MEGRADPRCRHDRRLRLGPHDRGRVRPRRRFRQSPGWSSSIGSGIDVSGWESGTTIDTIGVVGQRDSTGSGTSGYRVQPRDTADVRSVGASGIALARAIGWWRQRRAVAQRLAASQRAEHRRRAGAAEERPRSGARNRHAPARGGGSRPPRSCRTRPARSCSASATRSARIPRGRLLEVDGTRSTKSGMETLRVTQQRPTADRRRSRRRVPLRTGEAGEATRGDARDGSRRHRGIRASLVERDRLVRDRRRLGAIACPHGVEPRSRRRLPSPRERGSRCVAYSARRRSGAQPLRGYRIWPRDAGDVRVVAAATGAGACRSGWRSRPAGGAGDAGSSGAHLGPRLASGPKSIPACALARPSSPARGRS